MRIFLNSTAWINIGMLTWLSENVGLIESMCHGENRPHNGPIWWTQAIGEGWEIMFTHGRLDLSGRGIYIEIEDEKKAMMFMLKWV